MNENEELLQELFKKYRKQALSPEESEAFLNLLQNPFYRERVEALLRQFWEETEMFEKKPLTAEGKRRIAAVMAKLNVEEKKNGRVGGFFWKLVASVVLVLGMGILYGVFHKSPQEEQPDYRITEIRANYGEKKTVTMPDGTLIFLNAGSALRYHSDYNVTTRAVEIEGEAFFEVAQQQSKPFVVSSGQLTTAVLGTSFNVRAFEEHDDLSVALISGAVKIADGRTVSYLKPGEKLIYHKESGESLVAKAERLDHWGDWRKEILSFNKQSFGEIARQMEKWYNVQIHFERSSLQKTKFTGEFHGLPINKVLDLLAQGSPFSYRIENNQVYIR